jgi:hypothetical protein
VIVIPGMSDLRAVGTLFIRALISQDWTALQSCFEDEVQFRALIPSGFREASASDSAASLLSAWFRPADTLILLASEVHSLQDRLALSYRLRLHEDQWYVVEQRAYCDVSDGRIQRMDLVCSGFRPDTVSEDEHPSG